MRLRSTRRHAWDVRGAGTVETCTTDMYGYTYCYWIDDQHFSGATAFNAMLKMADWRKRRRIVHAFEHALRTELQVPERSRRTIGVLCGRYDYNYGINVPCFGLCVAIVSASTSAAGGFTDIEMEHDWDDLHAICL